jgi:hypothetical protein
VIKICVINELKYLSLPQISEKKGKQKAAKPKRTDKGIPIYR